jgi:hypothetical protein
MEEEKEKFVKICIDKMKEKVKRQIKAGLPASYNLGYTIGVSDVLWEYDRELWLKMVDKELDRMIEEIKKGKTKEIEEIS